MCDIPLRSSALMMGSNIKELGFFFAYPQKSVKEGLLLKQTSSFQRWKRRYFKLRGRTLYYAKDSKVMLVLWARCVAYSDREVLAAFQSKCLAGAASHSMEVHW